MSRSQLFAGLTDAELRSTGEIGEVNVYPPGKTIFREGDPGDSMFVIEEGNVDVTKGAASGRHEKLASLGPGEIIGEMSFIDGRPRSADAVATSRVTLRQLKHVDLDKLFAVSPRISLNLLKILSERLRRTDAQYIDRVVHQEKMSLVGQMAASIIHDLKNPMAIIRLQADFFADDEQFGEACDNIRRNVDRVTGLVNDLLDFSREKSQLYCEWVEPHEWLEDIVDMLKPLLQERRVELECSISTEDKIWVDPDKLGRVIYNLSTNAIDAMPDGGRLTLKVARTGADSVLFEVGDTGQGIPEEIRDRLFDEFVTHGKREGTGLGTAIAKKIVTDHGGTIRFTTNTSQGTTFHIRLPIPPAAA